MLANYGATIITGVEPGSSLGTVPLAAQPGAVSPASMSGQITSSTGSAGAGADIAFGLAAGFRKWNDRPGDDSSGGQSSATATVTTATGASCPRKTECASYTLSVPAANPSLGAFSPSGAQKPSAPASGVVSYTDDAIAFVPGGSSTSDGSPSELETGSNSNNGTLVVTAGNAVTAAALSLTGCQ